MPTPDNGTGIRHLTHSETTARFDLGSITFTVMIDRSLIVIAANDGPSANFAVWNHEIQRAALKALGDAQ